MRKLPCRLPAQDFDADHRQRGKSEDHEDLPGVVDRGKERQPEQEDEGEDQVDDNWMFAQIGRQESADRDLAATGPGE